MPCIRRFIEVAYHINLTVLLSTKQHYVEADISLVGVHLPIAVHYLESVPDFCLDQLGGFDEGHCLVVGD